MENVHKQNVSILKLNTPTGNGNIYTEESLRPSLDRYLTTFIPGIVGTTHDFHFLNKDMLFWDFMCKRLRVEGNELLVDVYFMPNLPRGKQTYDLYFQLEKSGASISFVTLGEGKVNENRIVSDYILHAVSMVLNINNEENGKDNYRIYQ